MKVSTEWLKELVELNQPIEELAESLSIAGFEVEGIADLSKRAEGVVVGFVDSVDPHPNSEKLKVCRVNIGLSEHLQIVCGASNVRKATHVLVAKIGASLSSVQLNIKPTEIRGVASYGMICSLAELGFDVKSDGIFILDDNYKNFPAIGKTVIDFLGLNDLIVELAITANRPDGMSMVGISREIAALTNSKLDLPIIKQEVPYECFESKKNDKILSSLDIYSLVHIDSVDGNVASPNWISKRLANLGIKTINAIVDITNYLMFEQGQPLHAFDGDKLQKLIGKSVSQQDFGLREANEGEEFLALDKKKYQLTNDCQVITCGDIPIALAGVIGGDNCSVSGETNSIWIESAVFKPTAVRTNSRAIGLRTESSSRFEKGISPLMTIPTLVRSVELISRIFDSEVNAYYIRKPITRNLSHVLLRRSRIDKILGKVVVSQIDKAINSSDIKIEEVTGKIRDLYDIEISNILTSLGCKVSDTDKGWNVQVPPYRAMDLVREIDLIEEIARLIGYDKFDSNIPNPISPGVLQPKQVVERQIRRNFCSVGYQEVVSSSLVGPNDVDVSAVKIYNPLLVETSYLRTKIWNEHLKVLNRNLAAGAQSCWLFEIGKIYSELPAKYLEKQLLCGAMCGWKYLGKWSQKDKSKSLDYYSARGKLAEALDTLNVVIVDKTLNNDPILHPGRSASLFIEGKISGKFGQIHPLIAETYCIEAETFIFELELDNLLDASTRKRLWNTSFKEFATVPSMERDIALIHSKDIKSSEIIKVITKAGSPLLEKAELIDRYEGSNLEDGSISQAFRITYRNKKKTLTEKEVNPIHEKIRSALVEKFKAELRS